jgi:aspartate/tyrosine/aromatic aminotransferase
MKFLMKASEPISEDAIIRAISCDKNCAWYNERFGMCCVAVDAHLKATEDILKERG